MADRPDARHDRKAIGAQYATLFVLGHHGLVQHAIGDVETWWLTPFGKSFVAGVTV